MQMLAQGTLTNKEFALVVNKTMHDGSKYLGQVSKYKRGQWFRSFNDLKGDVQNGYGTSRW